jgi:hypothetical protein
MRFKYLSFILLSFVLLSIPARAQWKSTFDQGMQLYNKANEIGKTQETLNDAQRKERISLYTSAADKFLEAKKLGASIAPRATVLTAQSLYIAGGDQNALGQKKEALATFKRAIAAWPKLTDVSEASYTKELSTFDNGQNWAYAPFGSKEQWEESHYSIYSAAARLSAFELKNNDEATTYAMHVLDNSRLAYRSIAEASLAMAHLNSSDACKASEYALKGLQAGANYKPANETQKKNFVLDARSLADYIKISGNCMSKEEKAKRYEQAAIVINRYHLIGDMSERAYNYGVEAYDGGQSSTDLLFALTETAYYINREAKESLATDVKPDANKWVNLLAAKQSELSSLDIDRLGSLYELLGMPEKKKALEGDKGRTEKWENTHFAFSTNPYNIIQLGQVLIAFDYMRPKASHELRFVHYQNTPNFFQGDLKEIGDKLVEKLYYSGNSISYTLKFTNQSERLKWFYLYNGPQVRYEQRDYKPEQLPILDKELTNAPKDTITVTGKSQRLDLTYMFGSQARLKRFLVDYYLGVGIGYKTMVHPEIDESRYEVFDARYRPAKWNKAYIPIRAGIRIGFILK